jgi:hypothetical protein
MDVLSGCVLCDNEHSSRLVILLTSAIDLTNYRKQRCVQCCWPLGSCLQHLANRRRAFSRQNAHLYPRCRRRPTRRGLLVLRVQHHASNGQSRNATLAFARLLRGTRYGNYGPHGIEAWLADFDDTDADRRADWCWADEWELEGCQLEADWEDFLWMVLNLTGGWVDFRSGLCCYVAFAGDLETIWA